MIISFNPGIFNIDDDQVHKDIAKFLLEFLDKKFFWDTDNLYEIFFDDREILENSKTREYLGDKMVLELAELANYYIERGIYSTKLHNYYLEKIVIGFGFGELSPALALKLIRSPSLVLLENQTNDWKFIRGIIKNYCANGKKKSVFKLIDDAVERSELVPSQVGGGGEFIKVISSHCDQLYKDIEIYKLIAIFDSDRNSSDEINFKWYNLVSYLKNAEFDRTISENWIYAPGDKILWHMLYKREIENYIPKKLLFEKFHDLPLDFVEKIESLSDDEHDFFNFDAYLEDKKNESSDVFLLHPIRDLIVDRCKHHKISTETHTGILEDIDEPELILQQLAKLI